MPMKKITAECPTVRQNRVLLLVFKQHNGYGHFSDKK